VKFKNSNLLSHPGFINQYKSQQSIGHPFIELQSVDSTNNYAMQQVHAGLAQHGAAWFAHHQFAGRGQRGKNWVGEAGENIALSVCIAPGVINTENQFLLNCMVSLGCYDFLRKYFTEDLSIKWPNDLYWRDRKAAGILIENSIRGNEWLFSIAGIGLNVNQTRFPDNLNTAVSIKQATGRTFVPVELALELCNCLEKRYKQLQKLNNSLLPQYNQVLYKSGLKVKLQTAEEVIETQIMGVIENGMLHTRNSTDHYFRFGEVEWLR
jgi:BirA family biotin operon repressor/biotin-[acetyl-CoA-carboxylase] ligase